MHNIDRKWFLISEWLYWIVPVLQGLLSRYKDRLVQTTREERTHVFQDYATLLSTVLTNRSQSTPRGDNSQPGSISAEEVVPTLSFLMDNAFLFTPSGLWPIVVSVMELVKTTDHVAPSVGSRWPLYLCWIQKKEIFEPNIPLEQIYDNVIVAFTDLGL